MTSEIVHICPKAISADGWLHPVRRIESPNFNSRPVGTDISLLVIHNISLPPSQFGGGYVESFFLNQLKVAEHPYFESISTLKVSAHCFIARDGEATQFVSFLDRAWHAGQSSFNGVGDCNNYSIGIELEGDDDTPYTHLQYQALVTITKLLVQSFPSITIKRIVGHCDVAPGRKTDPGPVFDWKCYLEFLGDEPCT